MKTLYFISFTGRSFMLVVLSICFSAAFSQTKTRVIGTVNWSNSSTWVKKCSGTVTCLLISKTVSGTGTSFTTEFAPGDVISTMDGSEIGTVASISSNTSLTLVSNAAILLTLWTSYGNEKVPGTNDDVEIGNSSILGGAVSVNLDVANATINSLTFIADNQSNTLTHNSTNTLTVNNHIVINQPTSSSRTIAWNINAGTANVAGNISFIGANTTISRVAKITLTSGTLNANGDLSFEAANVATKVIDMSAAASRLNLKGNLTAPANSATLTAGTSGSIFNYTGTNSQSIIFFPSGKYNNLYINNTNASGATLSAAISTSNVGGNIVAGNINSGSTFATSNYAVTLSNNCSLTVHSGSTLNAGTSQVSFGTGTTSLNINGTFKTAQANGFSGSTGTAINSTNAPAFTPGANSTIEFNASTSQVVTARNDYANLVISGSGAKTANGDITTNSSLSVESGSSFNAGTFNHLVKGTLSGSGTFVPSTSTMTFAGTGSQNIPPLSYYNIATAGSGTKTLSGNISVASNLNISAGTGFDAASYTIAISGNFTANNNFAASNSTVNFNGSTDQSISGTGSFKNLTVGNGHRVYIQSDLTISGLLNISNGIFDINGKTLTLSGSLSNSSTQVIRGSSSSNLIIENTFTAGTTLYFDQATSSSNYLKDFIVSKSVSVGNTLNMVAASTPGTIILSTGTTLTTNNNINLKSTAAGNSRIASLPVDGSGNATAFISGKVNMEKYIPSGKAWHLLSAPAKSTASPTINEAWQEGLTTSSANPNLYPGYGVKICGGSSANGYDTSLTNISFIRIFNQSNNTFVSLPPTPGTNTPISDYPGYFVYIRGDRSVNTLDGVSAAVTSTTMRLKAQINTGRQTVSMPANSYNLLANPYPSSIDFHTLTKNNVHDIMYVWDPKLAGAYGLGGYVTLSWNNTTGSYDATASVSLIDQYIPSGEAVLISSIGNAAGSIVLNESDKVDNSVSRMTSGNDGQKLSVNLYLLNTDSSFSLLDGTLATFATGNNNSVDQYDAKKLFSSNQSISIKKNESFLSIERRPLLTENDTCFLNLKQMRIQSYRLEIVAQHLDNNGMVAWMQDNYSAGNNQVLLNTNGTTYINFNITSDPASYAENRFSIVFKPLVIVPVKFSSIKAYTKNSAIIVEWQMQDQINVQSYEIEKSKDGRNFSKIGSVASNLVTAVASYKYIDSEAWEGITYYRVAGRSNTGRIYSDIAKVIIQPAENASSLVIHPNPVKENTVHMSMNNIKPGIYTLELFNMNGQKLLSRQIQNTSTNSVITFQLNGLVQPGKYNLKLSGADVPVQTDLIKQ